MKYHITVTPTSGFNFVIEDQQAKLKEYIGYEDIVVIPSTYEGLPVTGVCSDAFSSESPVHVFIPDSVVTIEKTAFLKCPNLRSISISCGTEYIPGEFVMECPALERIDVSEDNPCYTCVDGVLYNKGMTSLVRCPAAKTGELTVPDGVITVENNALLSCVSLTGITIPASTESISFTMHSSLSPSALEGFRVSEDNPTYTSIDGILYSKDMTELLCCPDVKAGEIIVPDGVITIGDFAFMMCTGVEKITLPASVANIGRAAFGFCESLAQINIPNGVTSLDDAFMKCYSLESIALPDTLTHIDSFCFQECRSLTELRIPESVEYIGDYAFSGCSGITELTVPASVRHIGMAAFNRCTALEFIGVDAANEKFSSVDGILYSKSRIVLIKCPATKKGAFAIPDGVRLLDKSAFDSCSGVTEVFIPAGLTAVNPIVFADCSALKGFVVDENNSKFVALDGMLMDKTMTTLLRCPPGRMGRVAVPDGVSTIGRGAFRNCRGITEITLPFGVVYILSGAFCDCTSLESINLPETVVSLGHYSFCRCTSLDELVLPEALKEIGLLTFSKCSALITAPHAPTYYNYFAEDDKVEWRVSSL